MAIDEPNAELLTRPLAPGAWGPDSLVPPPPTGPLAPPAPPPLTPDVLESGVWAERGAHRDDGAAPAADRPEYPDGQLADGLRLELMELLSRAGGRLQEVFDQYRGGVTSPAAVVAAG